MTRASSHPPEAHRPEVDDAALVARARRGDREAFGTLVEGYRDRIYALVYHMTSHREDTEDLLQDIFLRAQKALPRFRGRASFYTWLYRIAVNTTLNFLKKRGRTATLSLNDPDHDITRDEGYRAWTARGGPRREVGLRELQEKLNMALQQLSDKQRMVVVLHDIEGLPHEQIARLTRCSVGTIRSRLFYARRLLQVELKDFAP